MSLRACLPSLTLLALLPVLSGCGSEPACVGDKCPKVGGVYLVDAPGVGASETTCKGFSWGGGKGSVTLEQKESVLTINTFLIAPVTGILFESGGATFKDDHVDSTDEKDSFTMTMTGTFTGAEGAKLLKATMIFSKKAGGCTLKVPATFTQASAQ